jgi:hypothetical protein
MKPLVAASNIGSWKYSWFGLKQCWQCWGAQKMVQTFLTKDTTKFDLRSVLDSTEDLLVIFRFSKHSIL